jgi:hypothetical protein
MLNSVILDVVIAVIFTFLGVSLLTSAIVEGIASFFNLRSATLKGGIIKLLNDKDFNSLAAQLYAHALVHPQGAGLAALPTQVQGAAPYEVKTVLGITGGGKGGLRETLIDALNKDMPAYINSGQFASAMTDLLSLQPGMAMGDIKEAINTTVSPDKNPQINQLLIGMADRTQADFTKLQKELAGWFDNAMDRLSGVYKRKTQWIAFWVALAVSILVNANPFMVGQRVWAQPALSDRLKAWGTDTPPDMMVLIQSLPIGWANGNIFHVFGKNGEDIALYPSFTATPKIQAPPANQAPSSTTPTPLWWDYLIPAVLGWLVSAVASLFGAPFWFDTLQRVVRLKGAGPSPTERTDGTAAAG